MSEKYGIAYNSSNDSLVYTDDGLSLAPREWAAVQRSLVHDHVVSGALVWISPETIGNLSNPIAVVAKKEYERLSAEWEVEKAGTKVDDIPSNEPIPLMTDYDTEDKPTKPSSRSKK